MILIINNGTISSGDAAPLSVHSVATICDHSIRIGLYLRIKPYSLVGLSGNE